MGPLIDQGAVDDFLAALEKVNMEGGEILIGGDGVEGDGYFVTPAIVKAENSYEIVQEETFAPILYILSYDNLEEALKLHNDVPQGLSSSIFTLAIPQSLPSCDRKDSEFRTLVVKIEDDNPWGTSLCNFNASSKLSYESIYNIGANVSSCTIS
jgi:acyl-CoA reductase-like NAD-dependent aldehyde dehydrogenase